MDKDLKGYYTVKIIEVETDDTFGITAHEGPAVQGQKARKDHYMEGILTEHFSDSLCHRLIVQVLFLDYGCKKLLNKTQV